MTAMTNALGIEKKINFDGVTPKKTTSGKKEKLLGRDVINFSIGDPIKIAAGAGKSSEEVSGIFKKLQLYVLPLFEAIKNTPDKFKTIKAGLEATRNSIDTFGIIVDIDFFVNGKYKSESKLSILARVSLLFTEIVGTCAWLTELGVINLANVAKTIGDAKIFSFVPKVISAIPVLSGIEFLSKVAKSIGNLQVFSIVNKLSLGFVAERALGVAFMFFAADSIMRLRAAETVLEGVKAGLDLSSSMISIIIDVLVLAGITNPIAIGILGTAGLGVIITKLVINFYYPEDKKKISVVTKPEADGKLEATV